MLRTAKSIECRRGFMADETSAPPPAPPAAEAAPTTPFDIGEEFGTAKRNLPPAKIVLIALAAVLIVVGIYSLVNRATPQGAGEIDNIVSAEVPGQNSVLVAITFTLRNTGERSLWIHNIEGTLKTPSGSFTDNAASAVDFDRYFEALPALRQGAQPALTPETKLQPGQAVQGTIIVMFPVTQQGFDQRQSISAVIHPYDQPLPVVLTK
jgi:hypothetical protein